MLRVDHWWKEHWYLNASLFLPFQELNSLDLSFNGIYGWVSNEGSCIWIFTNRKASFRAGIMTSLNVLSNGDVDSKAAYQTKLIELNSLAIFSVAHNNFSKRTPERKAQFRTFEKNSYEDNPFLCGPPLENTCNDVPEPPYATMPTEKREEKVIISWTWASST
ncbi:hypothetical protein CJ030_MR6G001709 [Morella rubra]|uniref:Uncharacterized protein n=1 Tax=Morella rubra TaxID=262757 RepID=A0A6A1V7V3_9ROSI|nr:hypothetical protein CJ030_MR6G001709 [Morella rubra]